MVQGAGGEVVVHIGTHKTGTTAFQHWLRLHEPDLLRMHGIGVYRGLFGNAREIARLCADDDRAFPRSSGGPEWSDPTWRSRVRGHVRAELDRPIERLLVSCETLSFLRRPSEIARLAELLAGRTARVVLCTRPPADFLRSWSDHLDRDGIALSDDPSSFAYVGADSWLVDYESIVRSFSPHFGTVERVDYDDEMARHGSLIPGLLRAAFGDLDPLPEWRGFVVNEGPRRHRALPRRIARLVRHPLRTARGFARRSPG